jgi:formate hydrogenlyase subunit 6/NADH:ubiquinone oxidoreductase subunit I
MFRIFRLMLRSGRVTTAYPRESEPAPPAFRGRPELRPDRCDGEAACLSVCPSDALSLGAPATDGGRPWRLDLGRCVFCGLCRDACPNAAIILTNDFELAARRREDLVVTVLPSVPRRAGGNGSAPA